jgi:hypothetical protein
LHNTYAKVFPLFPPAIDLILRAVAAVGCCLLHLAWIWSLVPKHLRFVEPGSHYLAHRFGRSCQVPDVVAQFDFATDRQEISHKQPSRTISGSTVRVPLSVPNIYCRRFPSTDLSCMQSKLTYLNPSIYLSRNDRSSMASGNTEIQMAGKR